MRKARAGAGGAGVCGQLCIESPELHISIHCNELAASTGQFEAGLSTGLRICHWLGGVAKCACETGLERGCPSPRRRGRPGTDVDRLCNSGGPA